MEEFFLEKKIIFKMHMLMAIMDKYLDNFLKKEMKISFSQFLMMIGIKYHKGCSQKRVADFYKMTEAAVSRQLEILEERGLIKKTKSGNKREYSLILTNKGKKELLIAEKLSDNYIINFFSKTKKDEKEIINIFLSNSIKTDRFSKIGHCPIF